MQSGSSSRRFWLAVMVPFGLGYLVAIAIRSINAILAHPITEALKFNDAEIGFVSSTFLLGTALAALPLGVLLDYWGARRTQAVFFLIAGAGMLLFAVGSDFATLAVARFIVGIGMSGSLLAAVKAISEWVEKERIPLFNGLLMAFGGLGALAATTPSKLIELEYGWRTLCIILGVITIAIALLILTVSQDRPSQDKRPDGLRRQFEGLIEIYRNPFFWRIAPLFTVTLGGFIAMQGLWLAPWLQYVVGVTPIQVAHYLLLIAIATTAGMACGGVFSRLARSIDRPLTFVVGAGIFLHIATEILIVVGIAPNSLFIWLAYGFFAQVTLVNHAILAQHFGPDLAGRATNAANILVFVFAFAAQYLFGLIAHWWQGGSGEPVSGYQAAFACLIALEILAFIWFVARGWAGRAKTGEPV